MRFVTIMGLTLIARSINEDVFDEYSLLFSVIAIIGLIVDIIDCYKRWSK